MSDQASTLRRMVTPVPGAPRTTSNGRPLRVIAVTSGKGGVGKTTFTANLGYELSRRGNRVLLFDGDLGLANLNIVMGLAPRYNLHHVLTGERSVEDVLLKGPDKMVLLPSSSGVLEMTQLGVEQRLRLFEEMELLEDRFDVMLVDTAAGISDNVLFLAAASQEVVVVVTPEPTSITDAYATIKVLSRHHRVQAFRILVNQVRSAAEAATVYRQLASVVDSFLQVSLDLFGHVLADPGVSRAIVNRKLLMERTPRSPAALCISELAEKLLAESELRPPTGSLAFFWRRLLREGRGAKSGG